VLFVFVLSLAAATFLVAFAPIYFHNFRLNLARKQAATLGSDINVSGRTTRSYPVLSWPIWLGIFVLTLCGSGGLLEATQSEFDRFEEEIQNKKEAMIGTPVIERNLAPHA